MIPLDDCLQGMISTEKKSRVNYLVQLLEIIRGNPEQFDREIINRFFENISSLGGWEEPEFGIIKDISLGIKNKWGMQYFPIQSWFDGRNKFCIRILMYLVYMLDQEDKEEYASYFLSELLKQDSLTSDLYDELVDILININGVKVLEGILFDIKHEIDWGIIGPLRILLEIGDISHIDIMIEVLNKIDRGYYSTHQTDIRTLIVDFFHRYPDEKCIIPLLKTLKMIPGYDKIPRTLAKIGASALNPIINAMKETTDFSLFTPLVQVIEFIDNDELKNIDFKEIHDIAYKEYVTWEQHRLIDISIKWDNRIIPFLEELANSDESRKYLFARSCLEKRDMPISNILNENIFLKLYEYFFVEIDEKRMKQTLEIALTDERLRTITNSFKVFEQGVHALFNASGFFTLWIDPVMTRGLDLIAFSKKTNSIFLIGCTDMPLDSDILYILDHSNKAKLKFNKYHIIPMICTNKVLNEVTNRNDIYAKGVDLLSKKELIEILQRTKDGRSHKEIVNYLTELRTHHPILFR